MSKDSEALQLISSQIGSLTLKHQGLEHGYIYVSRVEELCVRVWCWVEVGSGNGSDDMMKSEWSEKSRVLTLPQYHVLDFPFL